MPALVYILLPMSAIAALVASFYYLSYKRGEINRPDLFARGSRNGCLAEGITIFAYIASSALGGQW